MVAIRWTVYIMFQITHGLTQYIVYDDSYVRFSRAYRTCQDTYNGTLLSVNQFNQYKGEIRQQCGMPTGDYWIGDYSTLTPSLTLLGCYRYSAVYDFNQNFTIINNTVAKCHLKCTIYRGIALKENNCQCIRSTINISEELTQLPSNECNIHKKGEILGGRQNAMSIYIIDKDLKNLNGDGIHPFCYYGDCISGAYSAKCSANQTAKIVCVNKTNATKSLGNVNDWWTAMDTCLRGNYGYLTQFSFVQNNIKSLCGDFKGKIWTATKQYRSTKATLRFLFNILLVPNIICRRANLQTGLSNETFLCDDASTKHGFLCMANKDAIDKINFYSINTKCIINITLATIPTTTNMPSVDVGTIHERRNKPATPTDKEAVDEINMNSTNTKCIVNTVPSATIMTSVDLGTTYEKQTTSINPIGAVLGSVSAIIILAVLIVAVILYRRRITALNNQSLPNDYESCLAQNEVREGTTNQYEALQNPALGGYENNTYDIAENLCERLPDDDSENKYDIINKSQYKDHVYEKYKVGTS